MLPIFPWQPYKPRTYNGNRLTQDVVNGISHFGDGKVLGIREPLMDKFWKKSFDDPSKKTVDEELLILMSELLYESI